MGKTIFSQWRKPLNPLSSCTTAFNCILFCLSPKHLSLRSSSHTTFSMSNDDPFAFRRNRLLALGHLGDARSTTEILDERRENRAQAAIEASSNFESSSADARRPTVISVSSSSSDSVPRVGSVIGGGSSWPSAAGLGWRAGSSSAAGDVVQHSGHSGPSRRAIDNEENEIIFAGGSAGGNDGRGRLYSAHLDTPFVVLQVCSYTLLIVLHSLLFPQSLTIPLAAGSSRLGSTRGRNRQPSPRPPNHDILRASIPYILVRAFADPSFPVF